MFYPKRTHLSHQKEPPMDILQTTALSPLESPTTGKETPTQALLQELQRQQAEKGRELAKQIVDAQLNWTQPPMKKAA
jgi:hypothetical protein